MLFTVLEVMIAIVFWIVVGGIGLYIAIIFLVLFAHAIEWIEEDDEKNSIFAKKPK